MLGQPAALGERRRVGLSAMLWNAGRSNGSGIGPARWPRQLFSRALIPEAHVDVDERKVLAQHVVGPETNLPEQARCIYDYVTGAMDYDATKQSFLGSTEHAPDLLAGNCNDIHALFVSADRSTSPHDLRSALEPLQPGAQDREVCGYHCWAEFFVAGLGWPADAPCATKYGTHGLFANLQYNHRGRSAVTSCRALHHSGRASVSFFSPAPTPIDGETHPAQRQIRLLQ